MTINVLDHFRPIYSVEMIYLHIHPAPLRLALLNVTFYAGVIIPL
jgi:hypothetical protein